MDQNADATPLNASHIFKTNTFGFYEGDQFMYFYSYRPNDQKALQDDDWLISPALNLDGSTYVLKFHYKTQFPTYSTPNIFDSSFQVLLSTKGTDTKEFTTVLKPSKVYHLNDYQEALIYIKDIKDIAHIAWHVNSTQTNYSYLYLDNISLEKVENCKEPYQVKITNATQSTLDVSWQEADGATSWEVLVVDFGKDHTAVPVQQFRVQNTPSTTITGLTPGAGYRVYVASICSDNMTQSPWSTPANAGTLSGLNQDCSDAQTLPVNPTLDCAKTLTGSLAGALASTTVAPSCNSALTKDLWYVFTAQAGSHELSLLDFENISTNGNTSTAYLYVSLYDQPCHGITNASLGCYALNKSNTQVILTDLIVGQSYYLRVGAPSSTPDILFELCLTTSTYSPLVVTPSDATYTPEKLISEILIQSDCELVKNVTYQNGDGSPETLKYNTLGLFEKGNSNFPFDKGIVLSTNEVQYVGRTYRGNELSVNRGQNNQRYTGDQDINDAIFDAGGGLSAEKRVTQVEFDFTPIKNTVSFEYLFASQSYHINCGVACHAGAMFTAWLVDLTTQEGQNLAKVTNTDLPIAINTITDATKSKSQCGSSYPEYFDAYYGQTHPILDSPIDFVGHTKALKSKEVQVVPGRTYRIKLAVIDFCTTVAHSSAVFFNSGSFDLGQLDLGPDRLVADQTALCPEQSYTLYSGLGTEHVTIQWYKDQEAIPGANQPDLTVTQAGLYQVVAQYPDISCEIQGQVTLEMYPLISEVVGQPVDLQVCRYSLQTQIVDLNQALAWMFTQVDPERYQRSFYLSQDHALAQENALDSLLAFTYTDTIQIYLGLKDTLTGCYEVFTFFINQIQTDSPEPVESLRVCGSYILPELLPGQSYFTLADGQGTQLFPGQELTQATESQIYILQQNSPQGCYEQTHFTLRITARVVADVFEDAQMQCKIYTLAPLSPNNAYYTQPQGQGQRLEPGDALYHSQKVYVYAASEDGLCTDESSFSVTYSPCPIQKGISPNGDGLNDTFDLSKHRVLELQIFNRYGTLVYSHKTGYTNQWHGQDHNGNALPSGTYYYHVVTQEETTTGWVQVQR